MTVTLAIREGLRAVLRSRWMVFLFFACNLLLAASIAAPMHAAIRDHLGNSKVGHELAAGFSAAWLTEFQLFRADFLKGFSTSIVYGGVVFLLLNTVLSAGAFEVFARGEGARMHAFGRGTGKYFFRFARVALCASLLYFLAFWLWQDGAARLLDRAFRDSAVERWHFYLESLRVALLALTCALISLAVDYAKAAIVIDERRSSLGALGRGAGFVLARLRQVLAIYSALALLALGAIVLYAIFARYFPQRSVATVLIWFLVAQVLLWIRWMFRLASWGAAVAYYAAHSVRTQTAEAGVQVFVIP